MILNILIGLIAGLLVPRAERWLKDVAESLWLGGLPLSEHEFDLAALLFILMVAAVILALMGVDSSAFLLCFGALVGLFGRRIWKRIRLQAEE